MYELDTRMGTTFQSLSIIELGRCIPASLPERLKRIKVTRLRPFYATNCSLFSRYAEKKRKEKKEEEENRRKKGEMLGENLFPLFSYSRVFSARVVVVDRTIVRYGV